jgi:hypothetical protein
MTNPQLPTGDRRTEYVGTSRPPTEKRTYDPVSRVGKSMGRVKNRHVMVMCGSTSVGSPKANEADAAAADAATAAVLWCKGPTLG